MAKIVFGILFSILLTWISINYIYRYLSIIYLESRGATCWNDRNSSTGISVFTGYQYVSMNRVGHSIDEKDILSMARLGSSLKNINLNGNTEISDSAWKALARIPSIKTLSISGTKAGGVAIDAILQCDMIEEIDLSSTDVSNADVAKLSVLKYLRKIGLNNTAVSCDGMASYSGHQCIEDVDLSSTAIDDSIFKILSTFSRIKSININGSRLSSEAISRFSSDFPHVKIQR